MDGSKSRWSETVMPIGEVPEKIKDIIEAESTPQDQNIKDSSGGERLSPIERPFEYVTDTSQLPENGYIPGTGENAGSFRKNTYDNGQSLYVPERLVPSEAVEVEQKKPPGLRDLFKACSMVSASLSKMTESQISEAIATLEAEIVSRETLDPKQKNDRLSKISMLVIAHERRRQEEQLQEFASMLFNDDLLNRIGNGNLSSLIPMVQRLFGDRAGELVGRLSANPVATALFPSQPLEQLKGELLYREYDMEDFTKSVEEMVGT